MRQQHIGRHFCLIALLGLLACWILVACAGGSSRGSASSADGSYKITITWPKRITVATKSPLIPVDSDSIVIDVSNASGPIQSQTVARPTDGSNSTTTTFHLLPPGTLDVIATAYPTTDGSGVAQATGSGSIIVTSGDVTPVTTVTMGSTIQSVSIDPPNPQVAVGASMPLTASCVDANGNMVMVSTQTLTWQSADPTICSVDNNGNASGVAVGTTTITLTETESGKSSTQTVTVTGNGGTIEGAVTDENGNPFPGVSVITSGGNTSSTILTTTAADGTYELDNVPPGDRVVTFYGDGAQTTDEVSLAAGETFTLNVQLQASNTNVTGPPVITVNPPNVDDPDAQATITGTITMMDSSQAVLIVNGSEFLFPINADGTFSTIAYLQHGVNTVVVRATNAKGTSYSAPMIINIDGTNTVVGEWDSVLVQGDAYNEEYWTVNADGSFSEALPDGTYLEGGTYTFANNMLSVSTGQQFQLVWISASEAMLYSTVDDEILHWQLIPPSGRKRPVNKATVGKVLRGASRQSAGRGRKPKARTPAPRAPMHAR